jgi:L-malate glycosyltransferase
MKLLILNENYPHLDNLMGNTFVHVRVKEYAKKHETRVFSFFYPQREIVYEDIPISFFRDIQSIRKAILAFSPDRILIHFYEYWMADWIIKPLQIPVIIWVHGYEALGWYRRLFNYTLYSPVLLNYIQKNTIQQYHFNRLIHYANQTKSVRLVFVSDWMRRIAEVDSLIRIKNYSIIPNPIDTGLFNYVKKDVEKRKNILLLRSFKSAKYGNDIAVKAIQVLSRKRCFNEFNFKIVGEGQLFEKVLAPLRGFKNVNIQEGAIRHILIPTLHKEYGIFLCPTRQDSQGVSMCEAMSSGLVPITSDNTAIPEFVKDNVSGFLTHSASEIADSLQFLYEHPKAFEKMSENAREAIEAKCSNSVVISEELAVIECNMGVVEKLITEDDIN